ncbi:MAG TPA: DUF4350 domain-containing protein [Albitalea sp.]|nr:DUF4350 domain-containing protein [Albitalea sp.]
MRRETLLNTLAVLVLAAAAVWFVRGTEWVDERIDVPARGEAASDRHYAIKQIAQRLGAKVVSPQNLDRLPPPNATLVLGSWHWDLFPERERALRQWVEGGGHLMMPLWKHPQWVPIATMKAPPAPGAASGAASAPRGRRAQVPACRDAFEPEGVAPYFGERRRLRLCDTLGNMILITHGTAQWSLGGPAGPELLRVGVGRGSVTVRLGELIDNRSVFQGDDALAFIAAVQLHPGDELWFVDTETRPPLLAVIWRSGAPAVLLFALLVALVLWRAGVRFGPSTAPLPLARRSVAEQIRGTASFIFQRDGATLHRAQLRALEATARQRIRDHDRLDRRARAEAIARATALDAADLARAMDPTLQRARRDLLATLALLETAVRRLALNP